MSLPLQERYINLLTDFGFKRVFGSEPTKRLLVNFLNALLPEHHQVKDVRYGNSENQGKSIDERKAIFDIYCQGVDGKRFIVEVQKAKQNYFKDRSVYYASFPIQEQAMKGKWDYELDPVYSIGILDFIFDDYQEEEADEEDAYLHLVDLKDQKCRVFYEKLRFIYIELPKYTKTIEQLKSHQDKWLYLLRHLPNLDDRPSPFQDPVFLELFEVAEIVNLSRDEQEIYERSLKYYRDLNNVVDTSKQVGIEEGIEQGIEIGISIGREEGVGIGREEGIGIGREEGIGIGREEGIGIGREEGIGIGREEGIGIGREEEKRSLLFRLLSLKLGEIPVSSRDRLNALSPSQLDRLLEQLFVFNSLDDLMAWLDGDRP